MSVDVRPGAGEPDGGAGYRHYAPRGPIPGLQLFHGVALTVPSFGQATYDAVHASFREPFVGLTTDGVARPGVTAPATAGRSTRPIAEAARQFLAGLDRPDHLLQAKLRLESVGRRKWFNAFPDWAPAGILLDDLDDGGRAAAMRIVEESLSEAGYAAVRKVMRLNGLLGHFVKTYEDSLREYTYFLTIFGEPQSAGPWGWQLMGHHLDLNCLVLPEHIVLTPMFLGSEFNQVQGVTVFEEESAAGPRLLTTLDDEQRDKAVLFPSFDPGVLPEPLAGPVDGRHVGGAGRDNLIQPYQGVCAAGFPAAQRQVLLELVDVYLARLPDLHAKQWRAEIVAHLDETHFAWIGDPDGRPPFYYRIHSPALWIEFDHHPGIFLDNDEPEAFHVHTIVRTPNGGDYGAAHAPIAVEEED